MSHFVVMIHTRGAAFEGSTGGMEVAEILRGIASRVYEYPHGEIAPKSILDTNGNTVGQWFWSEKGDNDER